jgi:malonyl CoA-acyl carrier protein transacylase
VKRLGLSVRSAELLLPVYSSFDGSDLAKRAEAEDLMDEIVQLQTTLVVNWPACIAPMVTDSGRAFVLDFGPGAERGAATLSARVLQVCEQCPRK